MSSSNLYDKYNKTLMLGIEEYLSVGERKQLKLLPLLFHCNVERTPGYISKRMPAGVRNYTPGTDEIKSLREMNAYYEVEPDVTEFCIESIYVQHRFSNDEKYVWVIYVKEISGDDIILLEKKCSQIERWLISKGMDYRVCLTSAKTLANKYYEINGSDIHLDKKFFLEQFYMESALLAGIKPCWWSEPVDAKGECSDLGWGLSPRDQDYFSYAIWNVLNLYKKPIDSWFNLLLVYCEFVHEDKSTFIERLKSLALKENKDEINPIREYALYVHSHFSRLKKEGGMDNMAELIRLIYRHYGASKEGGNDLFHYLLINTDGEPGYNVDPLNVTEYVRLIQIIYNQCACIFSRLRNIMISSAGFLESRSSIDALSLRLINNLDTNSADYVYIKLRENYVDVLERIVLEKNESQEGMKWSLKTYTEDDSQLMVKREATIVELIIWAYLNGVINSATQVSVKADEPGMDSIDIHRLIIYLEKNISTNEYKMLGLNMFVDQKRAVQAFLFTSFVGGSSLGKSPEPEIFQLIIYNTGEYHVNVYHGYEGYIGCVYNWNDLVKRSSNNEVPQLQFYGLMIEAGKTVTSDISRLMKEFTSNIRLSNSRTILKYNNKYYVSQISRNDHKEYCFDNIYEFYKYMEQPLDSYTPSYFSGCLDVDERLSYLMKQNRRDVVQLFYYLDGKHVISYVFDENGSLVVYRQPILNRQCYINNWVEFLNNSVSRVSKNIKLEIAQLLTLDSVTYEHVLLTGDSVSSDIQYLGIKLDICTNNNKIDLVFELPDESYRMSQYGAQLYQKISEYIKFEKTSDEVVPVYITDIDIAPESEAVTSGLTGSKLIHFLQYKKNVESQLNRKIYNLH